MSNVTNCVLIITGHRDNALDNINRAIAPLIRDTTGFHCVEDNAGGSRSFEAVVGLAAFDYIDNKKLIDIVCNFHNRNGTFVQLLIDENDNEGDLFHQVVPVDLRLEE